MSSVPERGEIETEYTWDLEGLFASDEAWEVGHRAALPYLVFACIAGVVAIIAALGTFVFANVSSGAGEITLAAIPIAAFAGQVIALITGCVAANRAAKSV